MENEEKTDIVTETNEESEVETLSIPKRDYEKLNQDLGSLKRELKDLRKSRETQQEAPKQKSEKFGLLEKGYLRAAGIVESDEVELTEKWHKEYFGGAVELDKLIDNPAYKAELEKIRTAKANSAATSNVQGSSGGDSAAKNTPEYWLSKMVQGPQGVGFPDDLPKDTKLRAAIMKKLEAQNKGSGKTFYND